MAPKTPMRRLLYKADGTPRTTNPTVLMVSIIALVAASLLFLYLTPKGWIVAIDVATARVLGALLRLFGCDVTVNGKTVRMAVGTQQKGMLIGYGCDGVLAYLILACAILPFPVGMRAKVVGLLSGMAFVFILNQLRLLGLSAVLCVVEDNKRFDFYHITVGQVVVLVCVGLFWNCWASWFSLRPGPAQQPGSPETGNQG